MKDARSEIFLARRRPGARARPRGKATPWRTAKKRPGHRSLLVLLLPFLSSPFSFPLPGFIAPPSPSVPFRRSEEEERRGRRQQLGFVDSSSTLAGTVVVRLGETGGGGPEMMEEGTVDLLELARLPDVLVVCSSTGWTDEKHMLYLRLLEESFISQLHGRECNFKGPFNCSSRSTESKQIVKCESADQGGLEIAEGTQAKSCIKTECVESPSCSGSQKDEPVCLMDNNASTSDPVEEATPQIRAASLVQSSKCYSGKHKHSPSRSAEGSDQNFDEETKGIGESRGFNKKRLKSSDDKLNDQVVPCTKEKLHQASIPNVCEKHGDKCDSSPKIHAELLDAEAGSPLCRDHGST